MDKLSATTEKVKQLEKDIVELKNQKDHLVQNKDSLRAQVCHNTKVYGSIAFISAFLGIGTGLYAWYKPNQSPIMPMLSTFFFGGAATSGIAAWHFHKMFKEHKQN